MRAAPFLAAGLFLSTTSAGAARAADVDVVAPASSARVTKEERPFHHRLDPTTPSAKTFATGYGFGVGSGVAANRPLPANVASAGASHDIVLTYGVTDRLAPFASAHADANAGLSAAEGARFQLPDPASAFRFTLAAAAFREGKGGAFGAWARAAASYDFGQLRVAGNLHFEKAFAAARDTIDILAFGGVSYRVHKAFRLGAEYVGQDLEDAIEQEEAEGGARHFIGPTAALDLNDGRLQLVAGPAFGLNERSPRFLGKVALVASF
jgi:hypothetical protein